MTEKEKEVAKFLFLAEERAQDIWMLKEFFDMALHPIVIPLFDNMEFICDGEELYIRGPRLDESKPLHRCAFDLITYLETRAQHHAFTWDEVKPLVLRIWEWVESEYRRLVDEVYNLITAHTEILEMLRAELTMAQLAGGE